MISPPLLRCNTVNTVMFERAHSIYILPASLCSAPIAFLSALVAFFALPTWLSTRAQVEESVDEDGAERQEDDLGSSGTLERSFTVQTCSRESCEHTPALSMGVSSRGAEDLPGWTPMTNVAGRRRKQSLLVRRRWRAWLRGRDANPLSGESALARGVRQAVLEDAAVRNGQAGFPAEGGEVPRRGGSRTVANEAT